MMSENVVDQKEVTMEFVDDKGDHKSDWDFDCRIFVDPKTNRAGVTGVGGKGHKWQIPLNDLVDLVKRSL